MAPRTRLRAFMLALVLLALASAAAWAALPQQSGTVDLLTQSQIRIDGAAAGDVLGEYATSAGDFDGDGISDLVMTNSAKPGAWVVFGAASDSGTIALASLGTRAIKINGGPFHWADGGRDVNGDGLGDVVLGDNATDSAWVVFGTPAHTNMDVASLGTNGFKMTGAAGDSSGGSVALAPDMNGDGKAEVVVGAFNAANNGNGSGSAFVVFGRSATSNIDLTALGTDGFRIDGAANNHAAGSVVAAGPDATGDGVPDILVGSPGAAFSFASAGAVYVVPGKSTTTNVNLAACGCTRIDGQRANDALPRSLAITPDMTGDGIGETVVGADSADNPTAGDSSAGSAWVVFGTTSTSNVALATLGAGGFRIDGQKAGDQAARSVASLGDVNGDGKPDVAVGALHADNNSRTDSGSAYVVFGTASTTTVNTNSLGSAGYRIDGASGAGIGDNLGRSVGGGADFNADGRPDVITAGEFADNSGTNSGSVYVLLGFGPASFSYEAPTVAATVGTAITPDKATAVKRTGAATFSVAPPLPQGIALDPTTGTISGAPTQAADANNYTVTMVDLTGTATATVNLKAEAPVVIPPPRTSTPVVKPCTTLKVGTLRADRLTGTSLSNLIRGGRGDDTILGLGGNDCLFGQGGNDSVSGGSGNDKLSGGPGKDKLTGGSGTDKLDGGTGADNLNGGKGRDSYLAGAGNDVINSRDGVRETVNCGKGRDTVKGDKNDRLSGCEKKNLK